MKTKRVRRNPEIVQWPKETKKEEGSVLTTVILFLAMMTFLAVSLSRLAISNANSSERQEKSLKAFLLAEAGISEAYSTLKQNYSNKDNPSLFPSTSMGGGSYDVDILQPEGRVVMRSIGTYEEISRQLLVEVALDTALAAFEYGIFSNKNGELNGSSSITGDLHSNENWELKGSTSVNGSVSASETVSLSGSATANSTQSNALELPFPSFDFNTFYNMASPSDRYVGDKDFSNAVLIPANGIIYVDGDVRLSGTTQLTGGIVATGSITVTGSLTQYKVGNLPAFMSRDSFIRFTGTVNIEEGMVYAGGDIEILGNLTMKGNLLSFSSVKGNGNLSLTGLGEIPPGLNETEGGEGGIRRLTYHE